MEYLGLVLDNEDLRKGLKSLQEKVLGAVENLTTVTNESQYKGQREEWTLESMRDGLRKAAANVPADVDVDIDDLISTVESSIGALDLNKFVRLAPAYRIHGFQEDLLAVFAREGAKSDPIELIGLPAKQLLDIGRQKAIGDLPVDDAAFNKFGYGYRDDVRRIRIWGLFSPSVMSVKGLAQFRLPVLEGNQRSVHYTVHRPNGKTAKGVFNLESKGMDAVDEMIHAHARNTFLMIQGMVSRPIAPAMVAKPA